MKKKFYISYWFD